MEFKAIVIDLDGMVYHGDIIIDDAAKVIALLAKSYKVLFLTNNSIKYSFLRITLHVQERIMSGS
jgi:ribonucleotide monophosphatase NagD (HAD superfamily)